jgi:hypothetical protein
MRRLVPSTGSLWLPCRRSCQRNRRAHRWPSYSRARSRRNFWGLRRRRNSWLCNRWWRRRRRNRRLCFGNRSSRRRWRSLNWLRRNRSRRKRGNHGRWRWRRRSNSNGRGRFHARRSGCSFLGCLIRYFFLFRRNFRVGKRTKMFAHPYCRGYFNRAGVRFFLGNTGLGQVIDDCLCLDLEFTSQLIDADLIRISHCPPGRLLISVLV